MGGEGETKRTGGGDKMIDKEISQERNLERENKRERVIKRDQRAENLVIESKKRGD